MQTITSARAMQRAALRWKRLGCRVALVPTMGCLHEGHLSLVRRARQAVGPQGVVVVSIYVNPTQFGPKEDFHRYPRDLKRDQRLCRAAGVDVVFAPTDADMYPDREAGRYSTHVVEESLSSGMEGASRPGHFRGVTTVVAKLFNLALPDAAVFGAKDFQQAAVVRRMTHDLNFPLRVIVAPTVREADGLAMSSRNQYLAGDARAQASILRRAIQEARAAVRETPKGRRAAPLKRRLTAFIESQPAARVDYVEFFEPETLTPVAVVRPGHHLALAVVVGQTRLIDNGSL